MKSLTALAMLCLCVAICPQSPAQDEECFKLPFGEKQVLQMLSDRPAMVGIIDKSGPTYKWVCQQFENAYEGRRVHWDYALPQHGLASEYVGWTGYGFMPGFVRVTGEISGRDQWMVLLYELENIKNAGELAKLIEVSVEQSSSKEEFIKSAVRLEHGAFLRLKKLLETWGELGCERPLSAREAWVVDVESDFEKFYELTFLMPQYRKSYDEMYKWTVEIRIKANSK